MEKEFELFLREKRFVQNVSEGTIDFYKTSMSAFKRHSSITTVDEISKLQLVDFFANMREEGDFLRVVPLLKSGALIRS